MKPMETLFQSHQQLSILPQDNIKKILFILIDFIETVNNDELKQGTVCQIMQFIFLNQALQQ